MLNEYPESPIDRLTGRKRPVVLGVAVLLLASMCLLATVTLSGSNNDGLLFFAYYAAMAFAVLLCGARAYWVRLERPGWVLVTLVLLCDMVANLLLEVFDLPFPSVADVFWLFSYSLMIASLLVLGRRRLGRVSRVVWLDGLIATLTLSALGAAFVFPAIVAALPDANLASAAVMAYPLADLVVLATAFVLLAVSGWRADRTWWAIVAAVVIWAVGDVFYSYQEAVGSYSPGALLDLSWPFAASLLAGAAWIRTPTLQRSPTATGRAGALAAFCGLLALGLVLAGQFTSLNNVSFFLSVLALAGVGIRLFIAHWENDRLLEKAHTDPLTGINSRGRLLTDASKLDASNRPVTVAIFDLDGFKLYNDSFGHAAGDALLVRIANRMAEAVSGRGSVYRIGGDEFAALLWGNVGQTATTIGLVESAMTERGDEFDIRASRGLALYPDERTSIDAAMALADERMYLAKSITRTSARNQVHEALVRSLREREPELADHTDGVRSLVVTVARRFLELPEDVDVIERAGQLHDVGKVAIPDAILYKPGPLDPGEKELMKQHTVIGERIISASPALAPVGKLVRHSHEHWDGTGYPDGLAGDEIPLGSRIILACDAFDTMVSDRPYQVAKTDSEAIAELKRCSGYQFDPAVIDVLVEVLEEEAPVRRFEAPHFTHLSVEPI